MKTLPMWRSYLSKLECVSTHANLTKPNPKKSKFQSQTCFDHYAQINPEHHRNLRLPPKPSRNPVAIYNPENQTVSFVEHENFVTEPDHPTQVKTVDEESTDPLEHSEIVTLLMCLSLLKWEYPNTHVKGLYLYFI